MGLFCVNMHFRTTDDKAVSDALKKRNITQFHLMPAKGGWTSLYEERASQQDDDRIRAVTAGLSKDLNIPAIAFLVHDSDIACYWLFENGQLVDEFNSCPDYFDENADEESTGETGGRPDVLVRYCKPGVREDALAGILAEKTVFAESVIEQLAEMIGIESSRALADYRDMSEGGEFVENEEDGDAGEAIKNLSKRGGLAAQLAGMFGPQAQGAAVDPQVSALVNAASLGKADEVGQLLAAGAAVDGEAPASPPGADAATGMGKIFPGGMPKIPMTALLAAVLNKHRQAAERLLAAGADPNRVHPLIGAPMHAACGAGDPEMLRALLEHGGDANVLNLQKLSPLGVIATGRTSLERIAQIQEMTKSMGIKIPGLTGPISNIVLPTAGWDACEKLLKEHGAR